MAEEKDDGEKKPLDTGLILKIIFAVINLIVVGGGLSMTYMATLGWIPPRLTEEQLQAIRKEEIKIDDPLIYTFDKFTVNLGGEPKRTIRLEINLEMLNKDGYEEVFDARKRAQTRDRILRLLNEKTFSDLETIQGKLFLKDRIASEVNSILAEGTVKDVFFTDFIIQ